MEGVVVIVSRGKHSCFLTPAISFLPFSVYQSTNVEEKVFSRSLGGTGDGRYIFTIFDQRDKGHEKVTEGVERFHEPFASYSRVSTRFSLGFFLFFLFLETCAIPVKSFRQEITSKRPQLD